MATTYKKLSTTMPTSEGIAEEDKWKYINVEKSVSQSPMKSTYTYDSVKHELDAAKARVVELEADLVEIEEKAKS